MRIVEDYSENTINNVIEIQSAKYIGDYAIRIFFSDRNEKLVDFKSFLTKSQHPSITKYLDEKLFSNFEISNGNINWGDYDLIFPIYDLYEGKIT